MTESIDASYKDRRWAVGAVAGGLVSLVATGVIIFSPHAESSPSDDTPLRQPRHNIDLYCDEPDNFVLSKKLPYSNNQDEGGYENIDIAKPIDSADNDANITRVEAKAGDSDLALSTSSGHKMRFHSKLAPYSPTIIEFSGIAAQPIFAEDGVVLVLGCSAVGVRAGAQELPK